MFFNGWEITRPQKIKPVGFYLGLTGMFDWLYLFPLKKAPNDFQFLNNYLLTH
jgi:hypothetical protein